MDNPIPSQKPRRRSSSLAAFLSFVWPGFGQLYLQRRIAAALFAIPTFAVAAWGLLELSKGTFMFAASMLDSTYALTIVVLIVVVGLWRAAAIVHAFILAGPRRRRSPYDLAALAVLLIAVAGMHGFAVSNAWSIYDFDTKIANNDFANVPEASPDPSASAVAPGSTIGVIPIESAMTPPPQSHRVTILLTGLDFGPGRNHALNDTIMLLSVDTQARKVALVSIPRDTSGFDLYWGGSVAPTFKINALVTYVRNGWIKSPDPAMTTLAREAGWLVGIPVNYYAAIDLAGFSRMIDAVGGVDVVNPKPIDDPSEHITLPAGPVHLDGATALKYVRSRYGAGDSDYTRSSRQQDVLVALERKVASPNMIFQLQQLLALGGKTIQTNFPLGTARDYVSVAQDLSSGAISKCVLGPPYSFHPDSSTTSGVWTSRLNMDRVANLSVALFGAESRYYGQPGVVAATCGK